MFVLNGVGLIIILIVLLALDRPALNIVMEEDLEDNKTLVTTKGSIVRMACSFQANPAVYQLIWFHEVIDTTF